MAGTISKIKDAFVRHYSNKERLSLSDIRPSRAVYYMAYAIELILFAVRGQFLPVGMKVFGINGWTVIHVAHMVASLVVMLLWSERFKPLLRGSALVMLLGFIPYIFLPVGIPRFIFGLIGYMGLGGVVTGARCGYAFASNNAERLFAIIFMYFSVMLVRLARSQGFSGILMTRSLPILLLVLLVYCVFKFREEDFEVREEVGKEDASGLYWAFAFFIVYFAVDGYIGELIDSSMRSEYLFVILGIAITGILLVIVFTGIRFSTWHLWNMFFLFAIGMGVFALLAPALGSVKPQYFFCGLTFMGWPLCLYTLGCAMRKFASYKLLKRCTLIYVLLSPLTTLSSDWIVAFKPEYLPHCTLVFMLVVTILMLMLSPISYKQLFTAMWISDIYKTDMNKIIEKVETVDRFENYDLTPRQKEVAALLLAAKTRRQIAGELGLSESTVKMHTSDLYKRLGINSKAELFKIFGVDDIADTEEHDA